MHETGWLGKRDRMNAPDDWDGRWRDAEGNLASHAEQAALDAQIARGTASYSLDPGSAESIVRDLARADVPTQGLTNGDIECTLCQVSDRAVGIEEIEDPTRHPLDCPWRRARIWVEAHDE